jgi:hypothetical protein
MLKERMTTVSCAGARRAVVRLPVFRVDRVRSRGRRRETNPRDRPPPYGCLTEALQALRSVRVVDFTLGPGQLKRSVTRGAPRAARVLAALGITELEPPYPPLEAATVM